MEEQLQLILCEVLFFWGFCVLLQIIILKKFKIQTRAFRQSTSNDDVYNIVNILREVNEIDKNFTHTEAAERSLDNKGMTRSHWVQASKQEQSFWDGLAVVRDKDSTQPKQDKQ